MPAAFGPVILATSRVTVMLVYAEETPSDFAREVPEGTRYVVKSVAAHPPFPGTFSCHLVGTGPDLCVAGSAGPNAARIMPKVRLHRYVVSSLAALLRALAAILSPALKVEFEGSQSQI